MVPLRCLLASLSIQTLPGVAHSEGLFGSDIRDVQACSTGGLGHMHKYKWLGVDNVSQHSQNFCSDCLLTPLMSPKDKKM